MAEATSCFMVSRYYNLLSIMFDSRMPQSVHRCTDIESLEYGLTQLRVRVHYSLQHSIYAEQDCAAPHLVWGI